MGTQDVKGEVTTDTESNDEGGMCTWCRRHADRLLLVECSLGGESGVVPSCFGCYQEMRNSPKNRFLG